MVRDPLLAELEVLGQSPLLRIKMVGTKVDFIQRKNSLEVDAIRSIVEMPRSFPIKETFVAESEKMIWIELLDQGAHLSSPIQQDLAASRNLAARFVGEFPR